MMKDLCVSLGIVFGLAALSAHAQTPPVGQGSIYKEPGIQKNRSGVSHLENEHIDPFTGRLNLHYVDFVVPGNGGLDLKIQRTYDSLSQDPVPEAGILGIGWDLHFGRLRIGANTTCTSTNWDLQGGMNPTFTLPDGSTHIIYRTTASYPGAMTKAMWSSLDIPDTSDRCQYGTGGVAWRSEVIHRSSSVRRSV